ncbi:MAG: hypothetical protein KAS84_06680 [Anaerolineales bacterium]|nr:hypothetical protein [Anaerolineales bacterium]
MKPKVFSCIQHYSSPYPDSIPFRKGEQVAVGEEFVGDPDWQDWINCQGSNGRRAWVPKQFLSIQDEKGAFTRDYDARELTIRVGEELLIREEVNGFGLAENGDGQQGWVPMKHLVKKN